MGQKKLEIEYVEDEKRRKRIFKTRTSGLLGRASQLATLCAIDVGVIVFSETGDRSVFTTNDKPFEEMITGLPKEEPELPRSLDDPSGSVQNINSLDNLKAMELKVEQALCRFDNTRKTLLAQLRTQVQGLPRIDNTKQTLIPRQEAERTNPNDRGARGFLAEKGQKEEVSVPLKNAVQSINSQDDVSATFQNINSLDDLNARRQYLREIAVEIETLCSSFQGNRLQKMLLMEQPQKGLPGINNTTQMRFRHQEAETTNRNDRGVRGSRTENLGQKEEVSLPLKNAVQNINSLDDLSAAVQNINSLDDLNALQRYLKKTETLRKKDDRKKTVLMQQLQEDVHRINKTMQMLLPQKEAERTNPNHRGARGSLAEKGQKGEVSVPLDSDNLSVETVSDARTHPQNHHQVPNSKSATSTGRQNVEAVKKRVQTLDAEKPLKKPKPEETRRADDENTSFHEQNERPACLGGEAAEAPERSLESETPPSEAGEGPPSPIGRPFVYSTRVESGPGEGSLNLSNVEGTGQCSHSSPRAGVHHHH